MEDKTTIDKHHYNATFLPLKERCAALTLRALRAEAEARDMRERYRLLEEENRRLAERLPLVDERCIG